MNTTPKANRLHIGIYGRRNSGKSSLINAIIGQNVAIVSDVAGTTADPVYKAVEIKPLGACMVIDTAGYDDIGELGKKRVEATIKTLPSIDIALLVIGSQSDERIDEEWIEKFQANNTPYIIVCNKFGEKNTPDICRVLDKNTVQVNALNGNGIRDLITKISELTQTLDKTILGDRVACGDTVILVMPQDKSAPKGRLILPQVQTIRELLDKGCIAICVTPQQLKNAIESLARPPKLIITDSQVFDKVYPLVPSETKLTSFSILFADYKGDIATFVEGAKAIEGLNAHSKVLIAEACTHAPESEDIGRVKIPALLRSRYGDMTIDIVAGNDFPEDLGDYDLIIHCGACMFNAKHVLSRINSAKTQNVPITNYGVTIAFLTGILDKVTL